MILFSEALTRFRNRARESFHFERLNEQIGQLIQNQSLADSNFWKSSDQGTLFKNKSIKNGERKNGNKHKNKEGIDKNDCDDNDRDDDRDNDTKDSDRGTSRCTGHLDLDLVR